MGRLSFVVQPRFEPQLERIGSEAGGYIEIERRGYLSAGEMAFATANGALDAGVSDIISFARKVASHYKIDLKRAYEIVVASMGGIDQPVEDAYDLDEVFGGEVAELMEGLLRQESIKAQIKALCLITYRIDTEYDVAELSVVHPDIISGLADLFDEEEAKSITKLNDTLKTEEGPGDGDVEVTEDLEKK